MNQAELDVRTLFVLSWRQSLNLTSDQTDFLKVYSTHSLSFFCQRSRPATLDSPITGWSTASCFISGEDGARVWFQTSLSLPLQQTDNHTSQCQSHRHVQLQVLQRWLWPHLHYLHLCQRWALLSAPGTGWQALCMMNQSINNLLFWSSAEHDIYIPSLSECILL